MKARTYMSTDWIEAHGHGSAYMARIFLTDEDEAYIATVQDGERRFFKVNPRLLKLGELEFFEKVMEGAEELPLEQAFEMGLTGRKRE